MTSKMAAHSSKLGFLLLPREIREMVYVLLHTRQKQCDDGRSGLSAQFLAVNRQIHREASEILYGKQPIRYSVWSCSYYLYPDLHQPVLIDNYLTFIQHLEICIYLSEKIPSHYTARQTKDTLAECIGPTLLGQMFAKGSLKHITLAFYLRESNPEILNRLDYTGALHNLPIWQRRTIIATLVNALCFDADKKRWTIYKINDASMEGRCEDSQLRCWKLRWEPNVSAFRVCCIQHDPQNPFSCFLSGGHYVLTKSILTLCYYAGFSIKNLDVSTKVEFRSSEGV